MDLIESIEQINERLNNIERLLSLSKNVFNLEEVS